MMPVYDKFKKQVHIDVWGQVTNQVDSPVWNKVLDQVSQSRDQISKHQISKQVLDKVR